LQEEQGLKHVLPSVGAPTTIICHLSSNVSQHPSFNSSQQHHPSTIPSSSVIQCIPTSVVSQQYCIHHSYLHIPISIISHQVDPNIHRLSCNKSQHIIRHQVDLSNTNIHYSYSNIHHLSSCRSQQYKHLSSVIRYPESYTHIILSVMQ
jgi:hypothetical protein